MGLFKSFLKFVIPSIVSMWIFSLYTMADGVFVAMGVGETALAAVNLSMPLTSVIFAAGLTFASGTSVLVSFFMGKGEIRKADELFTQNVLLMVVLGIVVTVLIQMNVDSIVRFLGATPDTYEYVKEYAGTISLFSVFFIVSYNLEVLVKADKTPQFSTIGVMCCALMNVILDYVFVIHFHWGVWGAAFATGLAQVTSTSLFIFYFLKKSKYLHFTKFRLRLSAYRKILPLGMGEGVSDLSSGIVVFLFNQMILSVIGEYALVSYTVISYLNTLVLMTMTGTSQGLQPLVSFYHGSGEPLVCRKLLKYGMISSFICGGAAFLAVLFGAPGIVGLFIRESADLSLFEYTVDVMRLYSPAFLVIGFNVVAAGFFAAIEKPAYAMSVSLGRGLILIAACLFTLPYLMGERGIWCAAAASEAACLLFTLILAKRYRAEETKALFFSPS